MSSDPSETSSSNPSYFERVPVAPRDPLLGLTVAYLEDSDSRKVNLGVGAYRTDESKPYILPVVTKIERELLEEGVDHEYAPIDGSAKFRQCVSRFIFGAESDALVEGRVCCLQSLSGTGALRVAGEFCSKFLEGADTVYVPDPTWGNHYKIFGACGLNVKKYRYYDRIAKTIDLAGFCEDIDAMPERSILLLHTCAHNPTGCDPTFEQWVEICRHCKARNIFIIFDTAYTAFASGDPDRDAQSLRYFVSQGFELLVTQSFAKSFGLYGERIGALAGVFRSAAVSEAVQSQLKVIARAMYSNPPIHGARIMERILGNEKYYNEWYESVQLMSKRVHSMRESLFAELQNRNCPGDWNHILTQIGMFSYTGLSEEQCKFLTEEYHIYLTQDGRINMAGLTSSTVSYVAEAITQAVNSFP